MLFGPPGTDKSQSITNCLAKRPDPGAHAGGVFSGPDEVRARLNAMKVAPVRADKAANNAATSEVTRTPLPAATIARKPVPARDKRVDAVFNRP